MTYYSNGKLLITAEYLVLDGAKALALPTKFGQNLVINHSNEKGILSWNSFDADKSLWFQCQFEMRTLSIINTNHKETASTLQRILQSAKKINTSFLNNDMGIDIKTQLTFQKKWGLGTSSTLINNVANWANIDAYQLQFSIFGGSAYDIAAAQNNTPIIYQLNNNKPTVIPVKFNPLFKDQLFFVYLNKKQNSRDGITAYHKLKTNKTLLIDEISHITDHIINTKSIHEFERLITTHEQIISKTILKKPIQEELFSDYHGKIKSLGAWGGDFVLATGNGDTIAYFKKKGYDTIFSYADLIL